MQENIQQESIFVILSLTIRVFTNDNTFSKFIKIKFLFTIHKDFW